MIVKCVFDVLILVSMLIIMCWVFQSRSKPTNNTTQTVIRRVRSHSSSKLDELRLSAVHPRSYCTNEGDVLYMQNITHGFLRSSMSPRDAALLSNQVTLKSGNEYIERSADHRERNLTIEIKEDIAIVSNLSFMSCNAVVMQLMAHSADCIYDHGRYVCVFEFRLFNMDYEIETVLQEQKCRFSKRDDDRVSEFHCEELFYEGNNKMVLLGNIPTHPNLTIFLDQHRRLVNLEWKGLVLPQL